MNLGVFTKQPGEKISVSIDYSSALDDGDSVSRVESCTVEPGLELDASPVLVDADRVRIWVDGGTDGIRYKITTVVTTAGGERFEDELFCKVREV